MEPQIWSNFLVVFLCILMRHVRVCRMEHICLAREVDSSCIRTTCHVAGTVFPPAVAMNTCLLRVCTGCMKYTSDKFEFEVQPVWLQRRCVRRPRFGPLTDRHPTYKENGIQKPKKSRSVSWMTTSRQLGTKCSYSSCSRANYPTSRVSLFLRDGVSIPP